MAKQAEFKIVTNDLNLLKNFKVDLRKEIIESGLDEPITDSILELQTNLRTLVNQNVRVDSAAQAGVTNQTNGLDQPTVNPPKSDEEILRYLTNGKTDLSKYNKAKDFTSLSETGVVFGNRSKGQQFANRVTLRLDIDDTETVQTQYNKAKSFFHSAIFALPDSGGEIQYFANPGLDLSQFVKIKCSTLTGDGDAEPFEGMSPARRFQRNRHTKGYSDWTLKQDAVNFIRNNFIDLTPAMNFIKAGDFTRARTLINRQDKANKLTDIRINAANLDTKDVVLPEGMKNYTNIIGLINNLQVSKKITKEQVVYSLVSNYDEFDTTEANVSKQIEAGLRRWIVKNENVWFNKLVDKVNALIKRYTR